MGIYNLKNRYKNIGCFQTIDVDLLKVENCYSTIPLYFEFINSGEATSNCGISEFSRSLSYLSSNNDNINDENYYLFKFLKMGMENYIIIILFLLLFTIIFIVIIILIERYNKKITAIFYSRNDFFPKKDLIKIRKQPIFILEN